MRCESGDQYQQSINFILKGTLLFLGNGINLFTFFFENSLGYYFIPNPIVSLCLENA